MNFTTAFKSIDPNNNFLHYLTNNGTKEKIEKDLIKLENENNDAKIIQNFLTKNHTNKVWEIPTDELCNGLLNIFDYLKLNNVNELGAGMGLLTARLQQVASNNDKFKNLYFNAFSKNNDSFIDTDFTYCSIKLETFKEYKSSDAVIVSWLHSDFDDELFEALMKNNVQYLFLVGEGQGGSCFSKKFNNNMLNNGYKCYQIPLKQVSQIDYYSKDKFRKKLHIDSRTCTIIYSKNNLDDLMNNMNLIIGKENLGNFLELSDEYAMQDLMLHNMNNKTYGISNEFNNLNMLLSLLSTIKSNYQDILDE
jgi:hypothetical protein